MKEEQEAYRIDVVGKGPGPTRVTSETGWIRQNDLGLVAASGAAGERIHHCGGIFPLVDRTFDCIISNNGQSDGGLVRRIDVQDPETITVPAGTLWTVPYVAYDDEAAEPSFEAWYAPEVGYLVKFVNHETEGSWELLNWTRAPS